VTVWLFTIDVPLYLPQAIDRILGAHSERIEKVVLAPPSSDLMVRQQYRMFGPVDSLRMGRRYAQGAALGVLSPAWQRRLTGRLHSVRAAAKAHDVPVETVPNISDSGFVDRVRSAAPELLLSLVCAQRLGPELLDVPEWAINLHPSLLPDYRGPAPEFWALYHDETETGWTAHVMVETFDAGPIVEQRTLPIRDEDTLHSLTKRLCDVVGDFAVDLVDAFPDADFETRPNPTAEEDYYPMPSVETRKAFKRRGKRFV
jgi:methionyl-tRNA formyltransferase